MALVRKGRAVRRADVSKPRPEVDIAGANLRIPGTHCSCRICEVNKLVVDARCLENIYDEYIAAAPAWSTSNRVSGPAGSYFQDSMRISALYDQQSGRET